MVEPLSQHFVPELSSEDGPNGVERLPEASGPTGVAAWPAAAGRQNPRARPRLDIALNRSELGASDGIAQYVRLSGLIRNRIVDGYWKVGDRLPTVTELAGKLGIARVTVRHAYGILCKEGLISSRRGRGTHVEAVPPALTAGLRAAINDPYSSGQDVRYVVLSRDLRMNLPTDLAGEASVRDDYVRICKLHLLEGEPFCLAALYIASDIYRRMPRRAEERMKIANALLRTPGLELATMRQTTTIVPADEAIARQLNYRFGASVAYVKRRVLDAEGFVAYAGHVWYRGDRFISETEMPFDTWMRYPGASQPDAKPLRRSEGTKAVGA